MTLLETFITENDVLTARQHKQRLEKRLINITEKVFIETTSYLTT
jgi:hypothetical protein